MREQRACCCPIESDLPRSQGKRHTVVAISQPRPGSPLVSAVPGSCPWYMYLAPPRYVQDQSLLRVGATSSSSNAIGASSSETATPAPVVSPIARSGGWLDSASVPNERIVVRQQSRHETSVAPISCTSSRALSTMKMP